MMNETVQHGRAQGAMPDFEELMKLTLDCEKGQVREQEILKNREIQLRQDKRDAQRTKRIVRDQLSCRWARHTTIDNSCRVLSLYNLRF
jgi:hypothetical protein